MADLDFTKYLPTDRFSGTLIGRVWTTDSIPGPSPVLVKEEGVYDLSHIAPTCSELLNQGIYPPGFNITNIKRIGGYEEIIANSFVEHKDSNKHCFLSPFDLQCIKGCGVTFVVSMLERVIEERAGGDPIVAEEIRQKIHLKIGENISEIVPGSPEADKLKIWLQS